MAFIMPCVALVLTQKLTIANDRIVDAALTQTMPEHGLIAGDDGRLETVLELFYDREHTNIGAT